MKTMNLKLNIPVFHIITENSKIFILEFDELKMLLFTDLNADIFFKVDSNSLAFGCLAICKSTVKPVRVWIKIKAEIAT